MAEGYRDDPLQYLRDEISELEDVERRLMWVVERGYGAPPSPKREVEPNDDESRRAWLENRRDALQDHVDALQAGIEDDGRLGQPIDNVTSTTPLERERNLEFGKWLMWIAGAWATWKFVKWVMFNAYW